MPFIENNARWLRILGTPFTPFYALGSALHNRRYDSGRAASATFGFPVICVGNLCAGGSGKTPATEYLVRLLSPLYHVGVVSRGYGRSTKENILARPDMDAARIGDEPLQYMQKFGQGTPHGFSLYLAAGRKEGIAELKALRPECGVVVLDDAYQHRQVRAGLSILLTEYARPYFKDRLLPMGLLRESRKGSRRADIIVVTKCPETLSQAQKEAFLAECRPLPHQKVFFSTIEYESVELPPNLVLLTGIARPESMEEHLRRQGFDILRHFRFGDHHAYTESDLQPVADYCRAASARKKELTLLTTQKDLARLDRPELRRVLEGVPLRALPIRMRFLFGEGEAFDREILRFAASHEKI
ncbi:MAG: tetraacyldisaccharide 4'-kinase [Bacteroides sp.]|nr:tetraacyldisaccharide 4'-kinase [Bacteroides sp.]MCM1086476.1 tetraacyldisaccharide 4'-kinase [Bacteroides sp.]